MNQGRPLRVLTEEQRVALCEDYNQGMTVKELMGKYKLSRTATKHHIVRHCVARPIGRPPERHARVVRTLAALYGVPSAEIIALYKRARGRCEICGGRIKLRRAGRRATAHLDHDHTTGQPRGFLCRGCNQGLGQFKDDRSTLLKAYKYLWRTGNTDIPLTRV
jgi:hypothetical protein